MDPAEGDVSSSSPFGIDCEDGVVGALDANGTVTGVRPGHWAGAPVDETNANVTRVWACETPEACLGGADSVCRTPNPNPDPDPDPNPNPNPKPKPNPNPNPSPNPSPHPNQACRTGHEGVLCAGCLPRYTRSLGRLCVPFDADEQSVALGAAVLSVAALLFSALVSSP